ncbi:MAG: Dimethylmenaquinone methyltransferase [Acidimicrobiaceae bacterium]|nr:Dimethylmenaquinone methyltransferase [Acidimicrobiaceae bacterium]
MTTIVDEERRNQLASLGAAAVYESLGRRNALSPAIKPLWSPAVLAGPVFTVEAVVADNLALHHAVAEAPAGAVIIASVSEPGPVPLWGDLLSTISKEKGIAGLVIDAMVRDCDRIRALEFPVFGHGTSLYGPSKNAWGRLGVDIAIDGVTIRPGDWVLADGDGVVIIPADELESALVAASAVRDREREIVRRAALGESTLVQLNLGQPPA